MNTFQPRSTMAAAFGRLGHSVSKSLPCAQCTTRFPECCQVASSNACASFMFSYRSAQRSAKVLNFRRFHHVRIIATSSQGIEKVTRSDPETNGQRISCPWLPPQITSAKPPKKATRPSARCHHSRRARTTTATSSGVNASSGISAGSISEASAPVVGGDASADRTVARSDRPFPLESTFW